MSTPVYVEDVSTPLCNRSDRSSVGLADAVGLSDSQEPPMLGTQVESLHVRTAGTVQLDVQQNGGDVGIHNCPVDDGASLALWKAFGRNGSISAPATDNPTSPPRASEADEPTLPWYARGLSPSPKIAMARSDKSPLREGNRVQQSQLIDGCERSSASPTVLESSLVRQQDALRPAFSISANTAPSEGSTSEPAPSRSAATTDAADTEGSDGDEPLLARRRRRTRLRTRGSVSPPPPLTPQSSARSVEVKSTTAIHRRKRLRRRQGPRPDPPTPKTDDTSTSLTMSTSSRGDDERWSIQCFIERKMIGSQEMITIQVPALDLRATSGRVSILSPLDDTSQMTLNLSAANGGRHGARFSRAEEDLLVELKELREPKLSWREIHRHFPQRTMGSLQVHYSTQLKGRRLSKRRALRC